MYIFEGIVCIVHKDIMDGIKLNVIKIWIKKLSNWSESETWKPYSTIVTCKSRLGKNGSNTKWKNKNISDPTSREAFKAKRDWHLPMALEYVLSANWTRLEKLQCLHSWSGKFTNCNTQWGWTKDVTGFVLFSKNNRRNNAKFLICVGLRLEQPTTESKCPSAFPVLFKNALLKDEFSAHVQQL